jgi:ethanolamine utilization microcompartment shell protein EutS
LLHFKNPATAAIAVMTIQPAVMAAATAADGTVEAATVAVEVTAAVEMAGAVGAIESAYLPAVER